MTKQRSTVAHAVTDVCMTFWVAAWITVGWYLRKIILSVAEVGHAIEASGVGLSRSLAEAGGQATRVPVVGDRLSLPLDDASMSARAMAEAGRSMADAIETFGTIAGILVALAPVLPMLIIYTYARRNR